MSGKIYIGGNLNLQIRMMRELNLADPFFGSFLEAYGEGFRRWKDRKGNDEVYVVEEDGCLRGLMKLKVETEEEVYDDMSRILIPKRRLKLSSLKVEPNKYDISGMLMRLMLERSEREGIDEIYGTLRPDVSFSRQARQYMEKLGFRKYCEKYSRGIKEDVFVYTIEHIGSMRIENVVKGANQGYGHIDIYKEEI